MIRRSAFCCVALLSVSACSDEAVLDLFPSERCVESTCLDPQTTIGSGGTTSSSGSASAVTGGGGAPEACGALAERVQVSRPELPAPAVGSSEYNPMVLAPRADGTSLLAYREDGAKRLRVVLLTETGEFAREVVRFDGDEAHALLSHEAGGGALVFMRQDPDIYSPEYCREGDDPSKPLCGSMELVRFDESGGSLFQTTLTDEINVAEEDSSFIYWFEHTARIVWAEDTYGVYFRSARKTPSYVSPEHIGTDTLRFIDAAGNRLDGGWSFGPSFGDVDPDSPLQGCFYSWSVRLAHQAGVWVAACHADITPNAHRVVVIDDDGAREMTFLEGSAPTDRALGGIVPAGEDFWLSYLRRGVDNLELHLARLTTIPSLRDDRVIEAAENLDSVYVFRTYMARYGDDLLLGWKSNEKLVLAIADLETGGLVDGPVVTDAPIDDFVEFVAYPDGDVGFAHSASNNEVTVTRVLACDE